jgi:hypothetical protein
MPLVPEYYLLINNVPQGPYTLEQIQHWIKSHSGSMDINSVAFAIAGNQNWQPISDFIAPVVPPASRPPVPKEKAPLLKAIQYNDLETLDVAKHQKNVLWVLVLTLLTFWMPFVSIVTGIFGVVFIYRLAKALKSSLAWLYIVLSFIPFVNLIAVIVLNSRATNVLKAHGIRVGLMGANQEDLSKLTPI